MLRLTNNPRVRRRLFDADELTDEARIDNFANILQESITRDRVEKTQKWNFDFEKEIPLEGTYTWYPCNDTADWIGVEVKKEDPSLQMKERNEATPKSRDGELPVLRKRRRDEVKVDSAARRRISFD